MRARQLSVSASTESSKGETEGNEGISLSSIASMRRHIREGVSSHDCGRDQPANQSHDRVCDATELPITAKSAIGCVSHIQISIRVT